MKKTGLFAALAAAAVFCTAMPAPAFAEQTYKTGDINMDGEVSIEDAQLALIEYTHYLIALKQHTLTDEQIDLADADGESRAYHGRESKVTAEDAQLIMQFYTECVANSKLKEKDIADWVKEKKQNPYALPERDPDYEAGDVNMDGAVTITDAQLLLQEYNAVVVEGGESILNPQQMALGDIYPNTADEDARETIRKMGYRYSRIDGWEFPVISTDYPISLQDSMLLLSYATEMSINDWGRVLDLFTADDYARYFCIPPEEERGQFMSKPLFQPGETYPADSVTVPGFRDFPLEQDTWSMQYAKVTKPGDFCFWYDGNGESEGCKILVSGTNQFINQSVENDKIAALERCTRNDEMKRITYGNTAIYYTLNIEPLEDSENWREENKTGGRAVLQWKTGAYWITVYTQEQYSEDVITQLIYSFVTP